MLTHVVDGEGSGLVVADLCLAGDGALLLAAKDGVHRVVGAARSLGPWPSAEGLVLADDGARALVVGPPERRVGPMQRPHRKVGLLDLSADPSAVAPLGVLALERWAPTFDGETWAVTNGAELQALRLRDGALWIKKRERLPWTVSVQRIGDTVALRTLDGGERVREYRLPGLELAGEREVETPPIAFPHEVFAAVAHPPCVDAPVFLVCRLADRELRGLIGGQPYWVCPLRGRMLAFAASGPHVAVALERRGAAKVLVLDVRTGEGVAGVDLVGAGGVVLRWTGVALGVADDRGRVVVLDLARARVLAAFP